MRWRQCRETGKFIPVDEAAAGQDAAAGKLVPVARNFDAFVSPVDGSLVRNHKELAEHNRRNNVVNSAEFNPEFFERKAEERAAVYLGRHSQKELLNRRREIYETWIAEERKHGR